MDTYMPRHGAVVNSRFTATGFPDQTAQSKQQRDFSLPELAHVIRDAVKADKSQLPWLKLAIFGDERSPNNSLRHNANVAATTGAEGDYDGGPITFAEAVARVREAKVRAILYTTPSNTDEAPHWRVITPSSIPLPPERRDGLCDRINGLVGGGLAGESWTLSQAYYFGSVEGKPPVQVEVIDGDDCRFVDQAEDVVAIPKPGGVKGVIGGCWSQDGDSFRRGDISFVIEGNHVLVQVGDKGWSYYTDTEEKLIEARRYLEGKGADQCFTHACMLRDFGLSRERSVELLVECGNAEDHAEDRVSNAWGYAQNPPGDKTTPGMFGYSEMSPEDQAVFLAEAQARYDAEHPQADTVEGAADTDGRVILGSDDDLATRFVNVHGEHMRYVYEADRWFNFNGKLWAEAPYPAVLDQVRIEARKMALAIFAAEPNIAMSTLRGFTSAQKITSAERLARGKGRILAPAAAFDADLMLLNAAGNAIDLESGIARTLQPEALCAKTAATAPGGDCPRWRLFLKEITADDAELQSYLQRVVGYCLTGLINEHALFFLYGTGANGKGVFLNTLTGVLADYAKVAPADMLVESKSDRHPTDMAMLQGARLVVAQETNEGRAWDEAKVKALTGGDPVTAQFMRQNFFTYQPQFKLMVASNHKPKLRAVDEAMRRRLHMIPFAVTIPPQQRDGDLPAKLREEWPGILQWAIDGCREWRTLGKLAPPAAVVSLSESYLASQDVLSEWIEDYCALGPDEWASTEALFDSFCRHPAAQSGERLGKVQFGDKLESHGLTRKRQAGTGQRGFAGIGLYSEMPW